MTPRKSRLERSEEKKAIKSTFFYVILTLGILVLLFVIGIPAITKFTALVAGVTGNDSGGFQNNSPPPPPPSIETLPSYTNDESIRLKGRTRPGYTVSVFFNDDKIEVLANAEGEFNSTLELSGGTNSVAALVTDNFGQDSVRTQTYSVVLDKEKPKLEIISPENEKQFYGNRDKQQTIQGQTEPDARITINDKVVIVRSDGKFDYQTTLSNGKNVYKIKSVDRAGNETESELSLNFTP